MVGDPVEGDGRLDVIADRYDDSAWRIYADSIVQTHPGGAEDLFNAAIDAVVASAQADWKAANHLSFDDQRMLSAIVPVGELGDWLEVKKRLADIASIVRMDLVYMTRQYAQVDIGYIGDEERLSRAMAQSDLALSRSAPCRLGAALERRHRRRRDSPGRAPALAGTGMAAVVTAGGGGDQRAGGGGKSGVAGRERFDRGVTRDRFIAWVPNLITLARLLSVPVAVYVILLGYYGVVFWIFLLAGISDAADGLIAKHYKVSSLVGSFLDPLADKALLIGVYVALGSLGHIPLWLVILIVFRDLLIIAGPLLFQTLTHSLTMEPLFVSKVNTVAQRSPSPGSCWRASRWSSPALARVASGLYGGGHHPGLRRRLRGQVGAARGPLRGRVMNAVLKRQAVFWLIVFVLFFAGIYLFREILLPFVAGMAVAYLFDPLCDRLERAASTAPWRPAWSPWPSSPFWCSPCCCCCRS